MAPPLQGETRTELLRKGASATHLNVVDSAKVKNIVEVCNVSAEEATRVLHACRMDETLAIERFLSGSENSSAWSEVSKKKKVPAPRPSTSRQGRGGHRYDRNQDRNQDRNHDRENERRSRGRDRYNDYNTGGRPDTNDAQRDSTHVKSRPSQAPGVSQARLVPKSKATRQAPPANAEPPVVGEVSGITWNEPEVAKLGTAENVVWSMEPAVASEKAPNAELPSAAAPPVSLPPDNVLPEQSPKREINYAAAAKVGTTHEKRVIPTTVHPANASVSSTPNPTTPSTKKHRTPPAPKTTASEVIDTTPTPTFGGISGTALRDEIPGRAAVDETPGFQSEQVLKPTQILAAASDRTPECTIPKPSPTEAWGDRSTSKVSESSAPGSEAVTTPSKEVEDSLVLQFGSFGFSDLNSMNWAAPAETTQITSKKVEVNPVTAVPPVIPEAPARVPNDPPIPQPQDQTPANGANTHPKLPSPVTAAATPNMKDSSVPKQPLFSGTTSVPLPSTSLPGGNFPHLMAMGVNNFGPPSFAPPYMIPPPMPYASGIGSFDHGNEANRNRAMNAPPTVPPMYEQGGLGVSSGANGTKYNMVPGLSEPPLTVPTVPKEMLPTGAEDGEKPAAQSGAPPMPGNVDALNTPFIMPQYPYLVPSYPSMQYGPPPGMAPPGPNHHYPFAAVGQVSNQGAYPGYHAPNTSMNKFANGGAGGRLFGYDDGSQLMNPNSRTNNGLNESMYSNSNYLNNGLPDTVAPKGLNEPNALGSSRVGVPSANVGPPPPLNNVGVPPPPSMPHTSAPVSVGVPSYSDYTVGQGHNVGVLNNGSNATAGGWNNRQSGVARTDANHPNPQSMGTNVHHNAPAAPNTGMYGPPPTAAPGYWAGTSYY